jgi:hypothetical protein
MMLTRFSMLAAQWAVVGGLLWWGGFPPRLRRVLSLLASAAGLFFLGLAFNTVGQREADTTGGFLIGSAYVTGKASASASLPYYVLTALCLLLGTLGLALPDGAAASLRRRWLATAAGVSMAIVVVRLLLERAAAPPGLAWAFGVTALAPLVGASFARSLRDEGRWGWGRLVRALAAYGLLVRGFLTLLYTAATLTHRGSTHFDISAVTRARNPLTGAWQVFEPSSLRQVMTLVALPQLLFWPVYTVIAGLIGAGLVRLAWALAGRGRQPQPVGGGVEMAPARQD